MQKTTMIKKEFADANRKWFIVDAEDMILGKLSVDVANILRGKNKAIWTPHVDCGDHVIVINSKKIKLSSNKAEKENWYTHSHYMSGLRTRSGKEMIDKYSVELITKSIKRMLPKNKLSRKIITKLHVYEGSNHGHEAQKPVAIKVGE